MPYFKVYKQDNNIYHLKWKYIMYDVLERKMSTNDELMQALQFCLRCQPQFRFNNGIPKNCFAQVLPMALYK